MGPRSFPRHGGTWALTRSRPAGSFWAPTIPPSALRAWCRRRDWAGSSPVVGWCQFTLSQRYHAALTGLHAPVNQASPDSALAPSLAPPGVPEPGPSRPAR